MVCATAPSASLIALRVVADHLVEHLLRILGLVEQRVDVGAGQLT